jgi:type IV pilus assembly protein PilA
MKYPTQAFVFIELLGVTFLVTILAAVAVPAYSNYVARSQLAEGFLLAATVKKSVSDYYAYRGKFPADNHAAGVSPPEQLTGRYVSRIEVVNGQVLVYFGHHSLKSIDGKILQFRPAIHDSSIAWLCSKVDDTNIDLPYRPSSCK